MNPKISILAPIYKVSKFIERFADSLFQQTFNEIEFIFINDGTTDDSIEKLSIVINRYPSKKRHVKIINHPSNRGLAAARNTALDASTGDYILAVDSDDYLELNMVELLYNKAIETNADITTCDFIVHYKRSQEILQDTWSAKESPFFEGILLNKNRLSNVWNKLIKRELYIKEECRVPVGLNYLEDVYAMLRIYYYAKKIAHVATPLYHYNCTNTSSITASKNKMHFENAERFWNLTEEFFKSKINWNKYQKETDRIKAKTKVQLLVETHSYKARKEFRSLFEKEERQYFETFRFGEKIMSLCVRYRLFLMAQLWHDLLWIKNRLPAHILNIILPDKTSNSQS